MKDIMGKIHSIFLEKTEERISVESLLESADCRYCIEDENGGEIGFVGKLSRIEFKEDNSSEIILYVDSLVRGEEKTITIRGEIGYQDGNMIVRLSKTTIGYKENGKHNS